MTKITWKPEYETGCKLLDDDHKHILELINECGDHELDLHEFLHEILMFVQKHFKHEEEILRSHEFENIDEHIEQHEELLAQVASIAVRYQFTAKELEEFLSNWVTKHILTHDMAFKPLFKDDES